jgi:LytS/YehU family sensor histidine kinase
VVNYVELQRIRFDDLFELVLEIPASIDLSIQVPRMMIQTHVENAIKHGLAPGQEGRRAERQEGKKAERQEGRRAGRQEGKIWVRVKEEETGLRVEIEDNGSGRGKGVSKPHESTGKGLVNQERIFKSLWQLYGIRIQREIIDLYLPDGSPGGMRVEIFMKDAT